MRTTYTLLDGTVMTAHNAREARLCRIIKSQIDDVVRYLTEGDSDMYKSLCREQYRHWLIKEIGGELDACYFLKIVEDPVTDMGVWEMVSNEFWSQLGWNE